MNTHVFAILEFDKIIDQLSQLPVSGLGQKLIRQLKPFTELSRIEKSLSETTELKNIFDFDDPLPIAGLKDISQLTDKIRIQGSVLQPEELSDVSQTITVARKIKTYFRERQKKYPLLDLIAKQISEFKYIEDEINRCIDDSTFEIFDHASPALKQLRRSIKNQEEQVRQKLENMVSNLSGKGYLQENIISMRNNRLVLMVKDEHKNKVKGLIHDQSATGATLFIEPIVALEMNNKIRALKSDEKKEIERILLKLTDLIREQLDPLMQTLHALAEFDFIYAKALLSQKLSAYQPAINNQNRLELIKGKHPLLVLRSDKAKDVVPLNLTMGINFNTLVISGPNAGGKTVALKTVGLLSLMVSCGLHIPADPTSDMAVFNQVFASIGDQQSIENDLSTFSSHIAEIRDIVNHAHRSDLILIDEIGTGTDPDEGAALAISLLEKLTERGCFTIVSTHQGALKVFAHDTKGVENGSMEFDRKTLQPTYRFRTGIPGSSYAYEIAERLGLSEQITNRAKQLTGDQKNQIETLLNDLDLRLQKYRNLTNDLSIKQSTLNSMVKLYEHKNEELKAKEKSLKKDAIEEAEKILKEANSAVEKVVKRIKEAQADRESIKAAHEILQKEREKLKRSSQHQKPKHQQTIERHKLNRVEIGQKIFWEPYKQQGVAISEPDARGKVLIETENIKLKVPLEELSSVTEMKSKPINKHRVNVRANFQKLKSNEIDIRGCRIEEGISTVDKFLDEALMSGFDQIYIIHGKGTGSLRKGIYEYLDKHPRVKSKEYPEWNLGDTGMTLVKLK